MVCLSLYVSFKIFYPIFVILNYVFVKIDGKLQLKKNFTLKRVDLQIIV